MNQCTVAGAARCTRAAEVEEVVGRERGGGGLLERVEERARRGGALALGVARVVPAALGGVGESASTCREKALAARVAVLDGDLLELVGGVGEDARAGSHVSAVLALGLEGLSLEPSTTTRGETPIPRTT